MEDNFLFGPDVSDEDLESLLDAMIESINEARETALKNGVVAMPDPKRTTEIKEVIEALKQIAHENDAQISIEYDPDLVMEGYYVQMTFPNGFVPEDAKRWCDLQSRADLIEYVIVGKQVQIGMTLGGAMRFYEA